MGGLAMSFNFFFGGAASGLRLDPDAKRYIAAVEAADGAKLEKEVKLSINRFVIGCKADGIWNAIKASCIMAGARTLSGALVPLAGTAPTNFNFVAGDYDRKTGLKGNATTKYLNSNRANNADPQDSKHLATYVNQAPTADAFLLSSGGSGIAGNVTLSRTSNTWRGRLNVAVGATPLDSTVFTAPAFVGIVRTASNAQAIRVNSVTASNTTASVAPNSLMVHVFAAPDPTTSRADARLAFYSIGESLDLALLGARVSTLMTQIGAAIP
jgi:hypothetical protein